MLSEYCGRLALNGLSSLTPTNAAELAAHRGKSLSLGGIRQLSLETAQELARYEGNLYLEGLTELNGELAQVFHFFSGKIRLKFQEICPRRHQRQRTHRNDVGWPLSLVFLVPAIALVVIACYQLFTFLAELISNA